jgi:hypothetical protein
MCNSIESSLQSYKIGIIFFQILKKLRLGKVNWLAQGKWWKPGFITDHLTKVLLKHCALPPLHRFGKEFESHPIHFPTHYRHPVYYISGIEIQLGFESQSKVSQDCPEMIFCLIQYCTKIHLLIKSQSLILYSYREPDPSSPFAKTVLQIAEDSCYDPLKPLPRQTPEFLCSLAINKCVLWRGKSGIMRT